MDSPKLSIVIPNFNTPVDKVRRCIESIYTQLTEELKPKVQIVLVDSSDAYNILESISDFNGLKCVRSSTRLLLGVARNVGYANSDGEYLWFVDSDDWIASGCLEKIVGKLNGDIDIFYAPFLTTSENKVKMYKPRSLGEFAMLATGHWNKIYKRDKFSAWPDFPIRDTAFHYLVLDKCQTFDSFDFVCYVYDNSPNNATAISRTFDFLKKRPQSLINLALDNTLENLKLRDEYVPGTIHNMAYMYENRNRIKNPEVKKAYLEKFIRQYQNFMSGFYTH